MNRQKKEQLRKAGLRQADEDQRRLRAENNLYKLLLTIMIAKAGNGTEGRIVFSPRTIAFGKTLSIKVDAGKQAVTLGEVQTMVAANLKIVAAPMGLIDDLEKLLPADFLRKTFVATVEKATPPKPAELVKATEDNLPPSDEDKEKAMLQRIKENEKPITIVSQEPGYLLTDVAPKEGDHIVSGFRGKIKFDQ